jgi:polyisoprenoid-binding protein YceI
MAVTEKDLKGNTLPTEGTWDLDPNHTTVSAAARHMMVHKVRGAFGAVTGSIHVANRPEDSRIEATIQTTSLDTHNADRDAHLKSADFLDVDNHPEISFKSTEIKPDGDDWKVTGDLTIRGVTKPVTLDATFGGTTQSPWGPGEVAFFAGRTKIDREKWDMVWNKALETGGVLVGKDIEIEIEAEATLRA